MKKGRIKNIVKGVVNEQFIKFVCEPSSCQCVPEFSTGGGAQLYNTIVDCQNDLTNCCTKYDCDPAGAGVCQATTNQSAPFDSMAACSAAHPNGCTPTNNWDCTRATSYTCAPVSYSTPYQNLSMCTAAFPDGCAPQEYDCNDKTGYQCAQVVGGQFADMATCLATYPDGCDVPDAYECDIENCRCIVDPNGQFTGPTAQADCQAALSDPVSECCCINCEDKWECVRINPGEPGGGGPKGRPKGGAVRPVMDITVTDVEGGEPTERILKEQAPQTHICVQDPNGSFTGPTAQADCQACVADPQCVKCNDPIGEDPHKCEEQITIDGSSQKVCVPDNSSVPEFPSLAACNLAIADPDYVCGPRGGGWECVEPNGCQDTGQGPYIDQASCEADTDDHYNMGFCDCKCPGQPEGCDAEPLISPVPVINGEYSGMHGQPYTVGATNLNLNDAMDKDGPLLTQAFRDRMAPCGPSYRAPGGNVKHDCAFWEYISMKKLPDKYYQVISPASQGGLASPQSENPWHMAHSTAPITGGTSLGGYPFLPWLPGPDGILGTSDDVPQIHANTGLPINPYGGTQSTTAHPRWQRRLEAKIAYIRCLRRNCCANTEWPDGGGEFKPWM